MIDLRALMAGTAPANPTTITIDPEPWRQYRESIACNPPETVALIGGRLDEPTRITDFFFMPPPQRGGGFEHGVAHVALDAMAMNYVIDRVLRPNGKYMVGLWHSHPGGYDRPSEPDLRLCRAILRNDDSPGRRWPFLIAPITTFDADGHDLVTAWILRKGAKAFEQALFAPPMPVPATRIVWGAPRVADMPPAFPDLLGPCPPDPLVTDLARLSSLLARSDALFGVPRYRAGVHLRTALRIAEGGTEVALLP